MRETTAAPVAVQLYSLRNYTNDLQQQLQTVAEIGYRGVEMVQTSLSAEEVRQLLQKHHVQVVSAHVPLQAVQNDLDNVVNFHQTIGNSWVIVPALPQDMREMKDAASWRKLGQTLADVGRRCLDAEIMLGYHNHAWEMAEVEGKRIIEWILDEANPDYLFWEPDLAWIVRGGGDPKSLLAQYAGRCPRVHLKDLAPEGQNPEEDGWADVGHGTLDWHTLLPAASAAGAEWYVVEHDKPSDAVASMRRSLQFLQNNEESIL